MPKSFPRPTAGVADLPPLVQGSALRLLERHAGKDLSALDLATGARLRTTGTRARPFALTGRHTALGSQLSFNRWLRDGRQITAPADASADPPY